MGKQVLSDRMASLRKGGEEPDSAYPHAIRGDVTCLMGAALYATSNVCQELLVKTNDSPVGLLAPTTVTPPPPLPHHHHLLLLSQALFL